MSNNSHEWLKRCFNCMELVDAPDAVCAKCGWDNHNRVNGNAALEQTILKDQYMVGKSLGRGGFGITYVGFDLALERRVAIKEFFPMGTAYRFGDAITVRAYTETEEDYQSGLNQALQESRTIAKHGQIPNVMQVYNVFLENGTVYMIMEYIDGVSLGEEVKRDGRLNWKEALHLMYPIMDALEKIHEQGLIHRDISPENIIRRKKTGEPVLLDFGSARQPKEGLTVMLKPGYAPAEQYSRNGEQDGRVDEYALCATMYFLVTGSAPASADLRLFAKKELKRPSEYAGDIPAEFEKVLLKGMELDSSNRYASMRELHEAFLEAEKAGPGTGERNGSGGAEGTVGTGKLENSRDSRDYRSSDDSMGSAKSENTVSSDDRTNTGGSGLREPQPEKKDKKGGHGKIVGIIAAAAVAYLGGFLLFGHPGHDNKDAEKEAVESAVEGSVAEKEEAKAEVENEATPTPEPTATNTPTPEPTATNTPTPEPTATHTPTPEPTATNTPTPEPTEIPASVRPPRMRSDSNVDYDSRDTATVLGSNILRSFIREVKIEESLKNAPSTAWDVSEAGDGSVLAWVTGNIYETTLTIAGEGGVSAPEDSSGLFAYYSYLRKADLKGLDTTNVTNMSQMFSWCLGLTSLDVSSFDTQNVTDMSGMFNSCESLTSLDVSSFDTHNVTDMRGVFANCQGLTSLDVSSFDTHNVTNMAAMFDWCASLTNLDVSSFDTHKITDMSSMFAWCKGLTNLDVSSFDTHKVTDMSHMFAGCKGLTGLDLSSFDTHKITNMRDMFRECERLTSLDVSSFDTQNVTDMSGMFIWCEGLTSLDLSSFDTRNVTDMCAMFGKCEGLTSLDVSSFDTQNVTNMAAMFLECKGLTGLDVSSFDTHNVTDMRKMFANCESLTSIDISNFDTSKADTTDMFEGCSLSQPTETSAPAELPKMRKESYVDYNNREKATVLGSKVLRSEITEVKIEKRLTNAPQTAWDVSEAGDGSVLAWVTEETTGGKTLTIAGEGGVSAPEDSSYLFEYYTNLQKADLNGLDTSNVTNMSFMFSSCENLTSVDVSNFDTTNATNMSGIFYSCSGLASVDVSNFDTRNVTDMSSMFWYCKSLTSVDVSNFDTTSVTDMSSMFSSCSGLTNVDVSNFDTTNVTNMGGMFSSCSGLTNVDVSNFDTTNVTNMRRMFSSCSSLTSVDVSNFDTTNVTDMSRMFDSCTSLTSVDVSNFDTTNVTDMSKMFYYCTNLTSLDVRNFDMSKANTLCMFQKVQGTILK